MQISLIVPCYNEILNLKKGVLAKIGEYTKNRADFAEVIIVDDGSTDESTSYIEKNILPLYPKFRLIKNNHQGKAFAVITGVEKAKSDYVMFSDMDQATPIEESTKLIHEAKKGYPIVIGSRNTQRKGAPLARKIMALGMIIIRTLLINLKGIRDTQCGFKLFEKKSALSIIRNLQVFKKNHLINDASVSAAFDLEFLYLAQKKKFPIKEVPVLWRHVETKRVNFLQDSLETLRDVIRIKLYDIIGRYK